MEELVPSEYYLSQNFPNPFKDNTKIKYCLPVKANIQLTLFNSEGERIKRMVNKIQEAGTYEIKFDSHDLPEGAYYYQLQAVDPELNISNGQRSSSRQIFLETKKMILMR